MVSSSHIGCCDNPMTKAPKSLQRLLPRESDERKNIVFGRHLTQLTITESSLSGVMAYERNNVKWIKYLKQQKPYRCGEGGCAGGGGGAERCI